MPSFDIVSEIDLQEVRNAVDQIRQVESFPVDLISEASMLLFVWKTRLFS